MSTMFEIITLKRSEVGRYTISTIEDKGTQETAVYKNRNKIVIVERYPSRSAAVAGHQRWADFCQDKPKSAYDVNLRRRLAL